MFDSGLKRAGILGINGRNLDYIFVNNPRKNYPMVDDKLLTKSHALKAGITSPELYGVVSYQEQLRHLETLLENRTDFVIKPSRGSGGGGIIVITGRNSAGFVKGDSSIIRMNAIKYHISNILNGLYSLGGHSDVAMIEYRVQKTPLFERIAFQGVPDIRVVCYQGMPIMAMLRLPTYESDGKANLHAGGIGVGISIRDGVTTHSIVHNQLIDFHTDTGDKLAGIQIPDWNYLLELAVKCNDVVGLGYIGVDIVIDKQFGPMLLEVNARPGISIQIANRAGLKERLEKATAALPNLHSTADKIKFAQDNFG